MFPQNENFNMSAFKKIEIDYAWFSEQGRTVNFKHVLGDFDDIGRPGSVQVRYMFVIQAGEFIECFAQKCLNEDNQVYIRKAGK